MQNVNLLTENYLSHCILKALWKRSLEGEHIFLVVIVCKEIFSIEERARPLKKAADAMLFCTISICFLLRRYMSVVGYLVTLPAQIIMCDTALSPKASSVTLISFLKASDNVHKTRKIPHWQKGFNRIQSYFRHEFHRQKDEFP